MGRSAGGAYNCMTMRLGLALAASWLRLFHHELTPPTFDGFRELAERAPAAGQLVGHAHGRAHVDVTQQQPADFQTLQTCRQHLVPRSLGALGQLAEPQGTLLQDIEDQRVPGPSQHLNRSLERAALGIYWLRHGPSVPLQLAKRKPLDIGKRAGDATSHQIVPFHWIAMETT